MFACVCECMLSVCVLSLSGCYICFCVEVLHMSLPGVIV